MKRIYLLCAVLMTGMMSFAQETTAMKGAYTVGTTEGNDYPSLADAVRDFDTKTIEGDVTFLITTDLTETINAGIINTTDFTLTIRPDKDEDRTITYTTPKDNVGPSGNIVVGSDMTKDIPFTATPTKNIMIDGAAEGMSTRRLSILTNTIGGCPVVFYGKIENTSVKNCVIKNTRTTGKVNYAMQVRTEKGTDNAPIGLIVENCYMEVLGATNAQAIYFNGSEKATAAGIPTNTTIRNCEIVANLRGIFFNGAKDATIEGCTFRLANAPAGFLAHGIMGNAQSGVINVKGNKFIENGTNNTSKGDYGIQSITASGGATVWMIENNYFAGYNAKADVTEKEIKLCAVRCGDSCVVRHNTFYMPKLTYAPATPAMSAAPVSLLCLAGTKTNLVQNNIFVCDEEVANVSLIRGSLTDNTTGNRFYCAEGNAVIVAGAAMCKNFAALEENYALQAATSKWVNVNFTDAAKGDLSLTGASDGDTNLGVARLAEVTKDINGKDRDETTYAGAYEGKSLANSTAINNTNIEVATKKVVRNGQVYIVRDGIMYDMMGQVVE